MGRGRNTALLMAILLIGSVLAIFFGALEYTAQPPNYHTEGTLSWQNLYKDDTGIEYVYRRAIDVNNPTDVSQSGVIQIDQPMYYSWLRGNNYFKVSNGFFKVVEAVPNAEDIEILYEIPHSVIWNQYSNLRVFFNYTIAPNTQTRYYLYYGNATVGKVNFNKISPAIYQIGGSVNFSQQTDFTLQTGFVHTGFGTYSIRDLEKIDFDQGLTQIRGEGDVTPDYSAYQFNMSGDYYHETGVRTANAFDPRGKTISIIGSRFAPSTFLSFHNGSLTPSGQKDWNWMGVELLGDPQIAAKIEEYYEESFSRYPQSDTRPTVSALNYHNSTFQTDNWTNPWLPYYTPTNFVDAFASDRDHKNYFTYEFEISQNGNLTFSLYENSIEGTPLITKRNLGIIPFETVYFQVSGYYVQSAGKHIPSTVFQFKSIVVSPTDAAQSVQSNNITVKIGPETTLNVYQSAGYQIGLTVIIGMVTLVVVIFFILAGSRLQGLMLFFTLILIVIAFFLMIWYFPIWDIIGMIPGRFGYLFVSESQVGLDLFQSIGEAVHPSLYYILLCSPMILIFTAFFEAKRKGKVKTSTTATASLPTKSNPDAEKSTESDKLAETIKTPTDRPIYQRSPVKPAVIVAAMIVTGIMGLITYFSLTNETTLIWYSSILFMLYLLLIYIDRIKDGVEKGKQAANYNPKKKWSRIMGKILFFYFVVKVLLTAYKAYTATDPIAAIMVKMSETTSLGTLEPLLLGYGVPQVVLDFINVIFADWLTVILLLVVMLQSLIGLDKEERTVGTIIRTLILAMVLYFVPSMINLPFYTLILALLYIAAWFCGYYLFSQGSKWGVQLVTTVIIITSLITCFATFFLSSFF